MISIITQNFTQEKKLRNPPPISAHTITVRLVSQESQIDVYSYLTYIMLDNRTVWGRHVCILIRQQLERRMSYWQTEVFLENERVIVEELGASLLRLLLKVRSIGKIWLKIGEIEEWTDFKLRGWKREQH